MRAGAIGSKVNYDDLEFAWNSSTADSRTSYLYQGGLNDSTQDKMVLLGSSNSGVFSLEDHYESMRPLAPVSRYAPEGTAIKDPKFTSKYPIPRQFSVTGELTSVATSLEVELLLTTLDYTGLSGASSDGDIHVLPEPADVLAGIMHCDVYVIPDDTVGQIQDEVIIEVAIWVEKWKPLVTYGRTRSKYGRRWYGSKRRGSRRSRKGRYRRKR